MRDVIMKYYKRENPPAWQPGPAVSWLIAQSYFDLRVGAYRRTPTAEMKELANAIFGREPSKWNPYWYWIDMVLHYLKNEEFSGADLEGLPGLQDWEKRFLGNVLCPPERRWTLREIRKELFGSAKQERRDEW